MMLPRVRRRHADGVSDNNVDMTWRLRRWRDDVYGDDVDDSILENKLDFLNVDHVTWRAVRDELDVLNVGSGCELPWRDRRDRERCRSRQARLTTQDSVKANPS